MRSCEPIEDPPGRTTTTATGCRPPESIANGFYTPVETLYSVGDVVQYGCEIGFRYIGKLKLKCSAKGRWNRNPPECRAKE
ncbi:mannan-binding lectin serine protease 2-like [Corticium candelabrum]|uniref:mannan-binding lectin serine protease 2-like n=1 Tax=Corticium candelabrum TaxID=121492 RepID=UPI002E265639|nr:mannan-binding lectin serine protease 2-like [Corticium candelabrum]